MTADIRAFINSISDTRVSRALHGAFDRTLPTNLDTAITAKAGGVQATAKLLKQTASFHEVTVVATAADAIALPPAKEGEFHYVKNSAALSMQVFGSGTDTIDSVATATGVAQLAGDAVLYFCLVNGNYLRLGGVSATEVFGAITVTDPITYDHNTTISANAAGNQASGTALTGEFNNITTVGGAGYSVNLPTAVQGLSVTVKNSGANSLAVFPFLGDSINALAVNLSVNIPVSGMVTFKAISATVWETQETIVLSAPTTEAGELVIKASDNAADYAVTLTNASHGQATVVNIPDGGAATSYVAQSTAALTLVETDVLDGATQGTGVASKAVVLDSSGNFKMADGDLFQFSADTLAAAGTGPSNGGALVDQITIVTGADGVKGVGLPAAADLSEYTVINDSPVYALKVWTVNAGDDVINEIAADEAFILAPSASVTFKAISATQWYAERRVSDPVKETHFEVFDDFLDAALDATNNWITFEGTTGAAAVATTVAGVPEGQVSMVNGAANDAQDKAVLSTILLAKGSLISLGKTVFEARVSFGAITGCSWGFGLGDTLANATEVANYAISATTVTDDAGIANAISFVFDTDATSVLWQACSTNAGTVGNGAVAQTLVDIPAVNTYQTLRIEVDASGDARFYIDGVLRLARPTAVATTALLIPYIWGDSGVAAQTSVTVSIDYIKFQGKRPTSNA